MSSRCSICRHPQRDSIDVSVLRNGTRFTARQFQVSRPSLDRHKRHLPQTIAADQAREVAASSDGATLLLSRLEGLIRCCENALSQAQADKNLSGVMRAIRELRGYFELKCKLLAEERRNLPPVKVGQQQTYKMSTEESCILRLQILYERTRNFNPLKIWQLKQMHDKVMKLVQAKLPPKEISEQMTLRDVGLIQGLDVAFDERLYGILRYEEWKGREEEVAQAIAQHVREGLRGYPGVLQHLDAAFIRSIDESRSRHEPPQDSH
jgi:hypothetical protein